MPETTFKPAKAYAGPIWSQAAEIEVLGAALAAPGRAEAAFERLMPAHFYNPLHGRLWREIARLHASGTAIEPAMIAHRLGADESFHDRGGVDWLLEIAERANPPALEGHVAVLADLHTRRQIEASAMEAIARARDTSDATGDDILADQERELAEISQGTAVEDAWTPVGEMMAGAFDYVRNRNGRVYFPIGIASVDQKLGGLNAGETTTIGAWTGMGKTMAGMQVAKGCGSQRIGVAYFSLEMPDVPMAIRMACDLSYDRGAASYAGLTTNITVDRALKGDLNATEWARFNEALETVSDWPIYYDTRPNLTVAQIQAATVRLHRKWAKQGIKPGPVIIDHIGKVRPTQDRRGNVTAETRDIANDLDAMAKRLNVPMVVLTQLNRLQEATTARDKRPTLASIKDSGALAENSRQIIFIYRPEYYFREPFEHEDIEAKADRLAELRKVENHFYWIIEKNSNGPRAQVLSYCKADCSAVREWNT